MKISKYGEAAIKAVNYVNEGYTAEEAWEKASCEIFIKGSSMQKKGCPRGAFLGLFSRDPVKLNSKNAFYAQRAVTILKNNPNKKFTPDELWMIVLDNNFLRYNFQINVVLTLWENDLI